MSIDWKCVDLFELQTHLESKTFARLQINGKKVFKNDWPRVKFYISIGRFSMMQLIIMEVDHKHKGALIFDFSDNYSSKIRVKIFEPTQTLLDSLYGH